MIDQQPSESFEANFPLLMIPMLALGIVASLAAGNLANAAAFGLIAAMLLLIAVDSGRDPAPTFGGTKESTSEVDHDQRSVRLSRDADTESL